MRRDPTKFRERFKKWKSGAKPYQYGIPYEDDNHNLDYDQARANQLGYTADETGHYPTRDYETGRYLKSAAHPTVSKSVYTDMGLGYDVFYNQKDGQLYSQPNWGSTYKDRLPKFRMGRTIGMPAMPAIAEQNSEAVHNILSYVPFIGTAMDVRDALMGDRDAIVPAMIGVAADTFGFNSVRNAIRATNAFKSAVKNRLPSVDAYRLMKEANNKVRTALGGVATYASDIYSNTLQMFQNKKKNIQTMKSE